MPNTTCLTWASLLRSHFKWFNNIFRLEAQVSTGNTNIWHIKPSNRNLKTCLSFDFFIESFPCNVCTRCKYYLLIAWWACSCQCQPSVGDTHTELCKPMVWLSGYIITYSGIMATNYDKSQPCDDSIPATLHHRHAILLYGPYMVMPQGKGAQARDHIGAGNQVCNVMWSEVDKGRQYARQLNWVAHFHHDINNTIKQNLKYCKNMELINGHIFFRVLIQNN